MGVCGERVERQVTAGDFVEHAILREKGGGEEIGEVEGVEAVVVVVR